MYHIERSNLGRLTWREVQGQRLSRLQGAIEKISPKLEDILEIHLLGCGALDQTYHVEDVQQAERTDEDSRACCWLSVGSQLATLEEAVEQRLPKTPEAASATEHC